MSDCDKLVAALRCKGLSKKCDSCGYGYHISPDSECNDACQFEQIAEDAAAAIEELQAQLPKLGEWQKAKPHGVVTYSDGYAECSHCHEAIWLGWGMNFCPHCGTQNKIIDPDDYDGAKMEVQE